MQTRSQSDALATLKQIETVQKTNNKEFINRYAVLANHLPIMVRQNGLQQALGFIKGKSKASNNNANNQQPASPETLFLEHLAERLSINGDITQHIFDSPLGEYMYYTRRCLEVSIWYRRFSESVLGVDATGQTTEQPQESADVS